MLAFKRSGGLIAGEFQANATKGSRIFIAHFSEDISDSSSKILN